MGKVPMFRHQIHKRMLSGSPAGPPRHYAFIGLGQMGFPMAMNLWRKINKEDTLHIYDVNPAATKRFAETTVSGGGQVKVTDSPLAAISPSSTILLSLPSSSAVSSLLTPLPPHLSPSPPKLLLDTSTISLQTSRTLHTLFSTTTPHTYLDTPISGGVPAATTGTLTFLLGLSSTSPLLPSVLSTLSLLGTTHHPVGPPTTGLAAKLTNNYLLSLTNLATTDATTLGIHLGIPPRTLQAVLSSSTGACWPVAKNNPHPECGEIAAREYRGGFAVRLMLKDVRLAREAARGAGVDVMMGGHVEDVYREVADAGFESRDFSVVYEWMRRRQRQRHGDEEGKPDEV